MWQDIESVLLGDIGTPSASLPNSEIVKSESTMCNYYNHQSDLCVVSSCNSINNNSTYCYSQNEMTNHHSNWTTHYHHSLTNGHCASPPSTPDLNCYAVQCPAVYTTNGPLRYRGYSVPQQNHHSNYSK